MRRTFFFATLVAIMVIAMSLTSCKRNSNERQQPKRLRLQLMRPDPSWGKPIPGSSGTLTYFNYYDGQFEGNITLNGLEPSHAYQLSLNEHQNYPIGDLLPKGIGGEGVKDFFEVYVDSSRNTTADFFTDLKPGNYHVKFFVKDKVDFQVVLYNDDLVFEVKAPSQ